MYWIIAWCFTGFLKRAWRFSSLWSCCSFFVPTHILLTVLWNNAKFKLFLPEKISIIPWKTEKRKKTKSISLLHPTLSWTCLITSKSLTTFFLILKKMGMSSAVKVSIRVRPFNRREINANAELAIQGNFIILEPIQLSYIFRFFFSAKFN